MPKLHPTRTPIARGIASVAVLAVIALSALGAKCIERTNVYVDADGYTHIVGEMHNETDVQGTQVMLRGTLYDAAGGIIATKDAPICPRDTQPHSVVMFDIRFDNPNVPPHASYDVRPISGKTLEQPLPDSEVLVLGHEALRFENVPPIPGLPFSDADVFLFFDVRNRSDQFYVGVQGCSAAYNSAGQVIAAESSELVSFDEEGNIFPAALTPEFRQTVFMQMANVPEEAAYVRAWLWFGNKDDATSAFQFTTTPNITIQTDDVLQ